MFEWSAAVASLPNYRHCFFFCPSSAEACVGSARREKKKKKQSKGLPIWLESARVEACTAQYPAGRGVTLPFERKNK